MRSFILHVGGDTKLSEVAWREKTQQIKWGEDIVKSLVDRPIEIESFLL